MVKGSLCESLMIAKIPFFHSDTRFFCSTVVSFVPRWFLMFHGGFLCSTVVSYVPLWFLMFHGGFLCSTVVSYVS